MTRTISVTLITWIVLAVAGWAFASNTLTLLAPLPLLAIPVVKSLHRGADPFEPLWVLVALFGFAYLIVPVLSAIDPPAFASLPGYVDIPPTQRQLAVWVSALAFLALLMGCYSGLGDRAARVLRTRVAPADSWVISFTAIALFAIGLASVAVAVVINNGLSLSPGELLSGDLRAETVASFAGRGYLSVGFSWLALSIPCATVWAAARGRRWRWIVVGVMALVAFVLLAGVIGSRILGLAIPVSILVVLHFRHRRLSASTVAVAASVAVAAGIAQLALRGGLSHGGPLGAAGGLSYTLNGFELLVASLTRVQEFLFGQTVVEDAFLTYLPRGLWEEKPVIYGFLRGQEWVVPGLYADLNQGATFPLGLVAEGYVNFGVLGALGFPFAVAVLLRAVYVRVLESPDPFFVILLAWLVPNTVSLMRGIGPMIPATAITVLGLLPLVLLAVRRP